jgi:soluble lytic murein transglycosylase-like protein
MKNERAETAGNFVMDAREDRLPPPPRRKKPKKAAVFSAELLFVPVFFGCLISLFFTVPLVNRYPVSQLDRYSAAQPPLLSGEEVEILEIQLSVADELPRETGIRLFTEKRPKQQDLALELYRQPEDRARVVDFFAEICPSREIAEAILANADLYSIPPALAFALAWEESRLNPRAVNSRNRNESIDRGLFQLNDKSFPLLELPSFFNPELNAKYGMGHLRHCLDTGGTEIAALAMYNAGTVRVRNTGTPKATLDYVSRILENRSIIERRFQEREDEYQFCLKFEPLPEIAEAQPDRQWLRPLMPLVGRR